MHIYLKHHYMRIYMPSVFPFGIYLEHFSRIAIASFGLQVYYPFARGDGGRLAHVAAEVVDHLASLVAVRRFHGTSVADSRSLHYDDSYTRMQHFVRLSTSVPFRRVLGDARKEFLQRLSCALHGTLVPTVAMLIMRALPMLWHASLLEMEVPK
jgi:hypothetical protein